MTSIGKVRLFQVDIANINRRVFTAAAGKLHCFRYQPPSRVADALETYGILEVYVDGKARVLLDSHSVLSALVKNQQSGLDLHAYFAAAFANTEVVVIKHGNDAVCILASSVNLRLISSRSASNAEKPLEVPDLMEEEINRKTVRKVAPTLAETEWDMINGDNWELLAHIMESGPRSASKALRQAEAEKSR